MSRPGLAPTPPPARSLPLPLPESAPAAPLPLPPPLPDPLALPSAWKASRSLDLSDWNSVSYTKDKTQERGQRNNGIRKIPRRRHHKPAGKDGKGGRARNRRKPKETGEHSNNDAAQIRSDTRGGGRAAGKKEKRWGRSTKMTWFVVACHPRQGAAQGTHSTPCFTIFTNPIQPINQQPTFLRPTSTGNTHDTRHFQDKSKKTTANKGHHDSEHNQTGGGKEKNVTHTQQSAALKKPSSGERIAHKSPPTTVDTRRQRLLHSPPPPAARREHSTAVEHTLCPLMYQV